MKKLACLFVLLAIAAVPARAADEPDESDFAPSALELRLNAIEDAFIDKVESSDDPVNIQAAAREQREALDRLLSQVEERALAAARKKASAEAAAALERSIEDWKTLVADLEAQIRAEDAHEGELDALVTLGYIAVQRIEFLAIFGGKEVEDFDYK